MNVKSGYFSGLGLDFNDIHEYNTDGKLPPASSLGVRLPVLLGEFNADGKDAANDDVQRQTVERFLGCARDGGYVGAIYWYYDFPWCENTSGMQIVQAHGSSAWRPAAYVLRDFQWNVPKTTLRRRR